MTYGSRRAAFLPTDIFDRSPARRWERARQIIFELPAECNGYLFPLRCYRANRDGMPVPIWEDMAMRLSSLFVASSAVALLSIELLCGLSGPAMSQTDSATRLPSVTVDAPKQMTRPKHSAVAHSTVARSTVAHQTSPTAEAPSAAPESISAKLAKLANATSSCAGGCQTSFRTGNAPWHGCSGSSGMLSSTCRNTGNFKTYSECRDSGLLLGWREGDVAWYCTSLALK